ncbi:MAG: glycoside hydrolase family 127 protein [Candidatus Aminicenantes bacterium]|nr:glycoside hydrolase family 127 protein [Candidatus Aminicenantes bacterium]
MRKLLIIIPLIACLISIVFAQTKKDYPIQPVPFTRVAVSDAFWLPRIETNRTVTIPFLLKKNEETGRIDNFAIAGGLIKGKYKGERYNDTDVYKTIEGAAYSLLMHPDAELDTTLDGVIAKIAAAQEPDGYLFTARTADPAHPQPGIGPERWVEENVSHELYNAGHLYEAAVAHFQATGKRTLLDVAVRNADLVASVYGPDKRRGFPGHQGIELALVKLYRVTGNEKYLNLAAYFLDQRGHDVKLTQYPSGNRFAIYNDAEQIQAHKPIFEQDEAVGHAVRAAYMFTGMADVAALTGDLKYFEAIQRLWENVVDKKMYLTGGIGARHDRERFGANYELPNLTAYAETCASIGNAFWNHRMFLLTGEAKYLDVMERVIYNGVISGVSLDGNTFFYANPLESDGKFKFNEGRLVRAPFFGTACCPGNISRFIPSFPGYVYAVKDDAVYAALFVGGTAKIAVKGNTIGIKQETRYPWDGAVKMTLEPEKTGEFAVHIRIPGWAENRPVPGDLYQYLDKSDDKIMLRINGSSVALNMDKGFARVRRNWKKGDVIELALPMPVRRVVAIEAVKDNKGKVALERGPLVYCAEWPDNGGRALNLRLADNAQIEPEFRPDMLKGIVVLKGKALDVTKNADGSTGGQKEQDFLAIPYYAWAHRGPGEMAVWIARQ